MGRYGLLQEISSHTASRQSQGLHRVRLCLARLRCAHASVVLTNRRRQWRWKTQNIGRAAKRGPAQAWKSRCWSQLT